MLFLYNHTKVVKFFEFPKTIRKVFRCGTSEASIWSVSSLAQRYYITEHLGSTRVVLNNAGMKI